MPSIQSYFIRVPMWVLRLWWGRLLGTVPKLRIAAGADSRQLWLPNGLMREVVHVNGVRGEWLCPPEAPPDAVLLHLHGGYGVLGLYNGERWLAGQLALACNLRTFVPDYRLAPEYPFPAGLDDCLTAYHWLLSAGLAAEQIVITGDSAGGYLTLSSLLVLRDDGQPLPAAAVCISPNIDPRCRGRSMQTNAHRDALLSPQSVRTLVPHYVGRHDLSDPHISPLDADLRGLPPILLQVGADEILLDDSTRFNECASEAGGDVTLEIWPHMWHVWHVCAPYLPEANQAIGHIAEFVRKHLLRLQ